MNRIEIADMILYMLSTEESEKSENRAKALEIADAIIKKLDE